MSIKTKQLPYPDHFLEVVSRVHDRVPMVVHQYPNIHIHMLCILTSQQHYTCFAQQGQVNGAPTQYLCCGTTADKATAVSHIT